LLNSTISTSTTNNSTAPITENIMLGSKSISKNSLVIGLSLGVIILLLIFFLVILVSSRKTK